MPFAVDYGSQPQYWLLFDRVVQQLVLQSESQGDLDAVAPLEINVREILQELAKEEELAQIQRRSEELEKENSELASSLAKKDQELEAKAQEKEDLESNLERTKEKLELELARANEARQRLGEIESQLPESSSSTSITI